MRKATTLARSLIPVFGQRVLSKQLLEADSYLRVCVCVRVSCEMLQLGRDQRMPSKLHLEADGTSRGVLIVTGSWWLTRVVQSRRLLA